MFWSPESELIITGWLLAFFAVDVALRVARWRGARTDRAVIRQAMAEGVSPVQAAYQRARWIPDAAEVAVCGLLTDGVAQVSDDGILTVAASAPIPTDPALRALVQALKARSETGTRFYEVLSEDDFAAFRARVTEGALPLKQYNGSERMGLICYAFPVVFGMAMHGGFSDAPAPGGIEVAEFWASLPVIAWPVLCLWAVVTWPDSSTPRWPRFNRHCWQIADTEVARTPVRDLTALRLHRFRPRGPRTSGAGAGGRTRGGEDGDVGDWGGDSDGGGFDGD
ncbi:hypothetical protein ACFRI7_05420 [Streptomyces sp. NPDC056716]|uniref:hypothetical protein n=1 Tax=unclassified Streptomyces TaxID=2593676 RepID=UPI0036A65049